MQMRVVISSKSAFYCNENTKYSIFAGIPYANCFTFRTISKHSRNPDVIYQYFTKKLKACYKKLLKINAGGSSGFLILLLEMYKT